MSRSASKTLSEEDRVLWTLVARTAKPLKGRAGVFGDDLPPDQAEPASPSAPPAAAGPAPAAAPKPLRVNHVLDSPTLDKLAKGRLLIEGRVDLHGMTQEQAYSLLLSFLSRAHAGGVRYVVDAGLPLYAAVPLPTGDLPAMASSAWLTYTARPTAPGRVLIEQRPHPRPQAFELIDGAVSPESYRNATTADYGAGGLFLDRVIVKKIVGDDIWRFASSCCGWSGNPG